MRKLIPFIILLCALIFAPATNTVVATDETVVYALIAADDAMLYRTDSGDDAADNRYFVLPPTYFTILLEEGQQFCKVEYGVFTGYVRTDALEIVDFSPVTVVPLPVTLRPDIIDGELYVRELPSAGAAVVAKIPFDTAEVIYYGMAPGEELKADAGDIWYYVSYDGAQGYIYHTQIALNSTIPTNVIEAIPDITTSEPNLTEDDLPPVDKPVHYIIIGALTLPALLIVYLLFRSPKNTSTNEERRRIPKYYR